ncbi:imidazolonepropionase-like amidohydrolase [Actinoalloteichus hoggarensis]|uniref:L-hydantoinase n=1 Tax=Actinoalloteichus hoggarensis TaxID=1470176 RepID=A0A221W5L7_9PSEU|nr:amidohydrolase family protein [Actinoalloteichus hoggarensis]ASO20991.1 L-hydantoinase [Actinoalloteichus hoggarensis]MBB5920922.1 imidazolonepropionase-like amidohydrolase [Actinoalloteichus hoggarensis]
MSSQSGTGSSDTSPLVIRGVHVVCGDGTERHDVDVVIADGRIARMTNDRVSIDGARVIDGAGKTLMPGLIDAHLHLDFLTVRNGLHGRLHSRLRLARALRDLLHNGVTAIRCMGDPLKPVLRLRDRVNSGRASGPHMVVAGPVLTAPGGHPETTVCRDNPWLRRHMVVHPASPDDARAQVRRLHAAGVDVVKFVYQGGLYGEDRVELGKLPEETARAIVAEATRLGMTASAHTHYQDDVDVLIDAGVDSFEHGVIEHDLVGTETLRRWADSGAKLVPTLTIAALVRDPDGVSHEERASRNLGLAHRAGVSIVAGTDSMVGAMPANTLHGELRRMVEAGMSESDVVRAATADAAEFLGLTDRGVVAEGRVADLLLLNGSPLDQIENVGDIDRVFHQGRTVFTAPERHVPALSDYTAPDPAVLTFTDATGNTVAGDVTVQYDTTRFDAEGVRELRYVDAEGHVLRTETVTAGPDLVTTAWTCEIPGEDTRLAVTSAGSRLSLTGTFQGRTVTRGYLLRGGVWMQWLLFDPATFVTSAESSLPFLSLGTTGRGALELTEFELTKRDSGGAEVETELVMPRWRRFWGAVNRYDAATGDLISHEIRNKPSAVLRRR